MTHPIDLHVGQKMKQLRRMRRMSQSEVAAQLKISFQQVQKYETGANRVSASRLYELSKVFGVSVATFFEGVPGDEAPAASDQDIVAVLAAIKDEKVKATILEFVQKTAA